MDFIKFVLILGFIVTVIIYFIGKIIEGVFNIIALFNSDTCEKHEGIIYNQKDKNLEADNSDITPF